MTPAQIFDAGVLLAPLVFWGMMLIVSVTAFVLLSALAVYSMIEGFDRLSRGESR